MIEDTIRRISTLLPQSTGDNLLGFRMDVDHAIASQRPIASYRLSVSGRPDSMIDVTAKIASDVESLADLSRALEAIWSKLAYQHFQASAVLRFRDVSVLRFITVPSDDSFFVSGTLRATGDAYPQLVAKHEKGLELRTSLGTPTIRLTIGYSGR